MAINNLLTNIKLYYVTLYINTILSKEPRKLSYQYFYTIQYNWSHKDKIKMIPVTVKELSIIINKYNILYILKVTITSYTLS